MAARGCVCVCVAGGLATFCNSLTSVRSTTICWTSWIAAHAFRTKRIFHCHASSEASPAMKRDYTWCSMYLLPQPNVNSLTKRTSTQTNTNTHGNIDLFLLLNDDGGCCLPLLLCRCLIRRGRCAQKIKCINFRFLLFSHNYLSLSIFDFVMNVPWKRTHRTKTNALWFCEFRQWQPLQPSCHECGTQSTYTPCGIVSLA